MNFKVGDKIVFQPQGNNIEDYFLAGVQEGDTGTVTYVDEEDIAAGSLHKSSSCANVSSLTSLDFFAILSPYRFYLLTCPNLIGIICFTFDKKHATLVLYTER